MEDMTWFGRRGPARQEDRRPASASGAAVAAPASPASAVPSPAPLPASQPVRTIDALGRKCPIPIIMLAEQIRDVPVGAVIAVLADDPAAYSDVPAWCTMKSHECVFRTDLPSGWAFGIRRRY
jgi:tRNA 2-thiouridine synthesizing protein A